MDKTTYENLQEKVKQIAKNFDNHTYTEVEIIIEELNNQPIQFLSVWNTNKVIDFVNWYIDLKELGENNKLENFTIVESFLGGDSVDVWKNIK